MEACRAGKEGQKKKKNEKGARVAFTSLRDRSRSGTYAFPQCGFKQHHSPKLRHDRCTAAAWRAGQSLQRHKTWGDRFRESTSHMQHNRACDCYMLKLQSLQQHHCTEFVLVKSKKTHWKELMLYKSARLHIFCTNRVEPSASSSLLQSHKKKPVLMQKYEERSLTFPLNEIIHQLTRPSLICPITALIQKAN